VKENERGNEFLCMYIGVYGWLSVAVNEYMGVYVCICLFCHASVCIFRERL